MMNVKRRASMAAVALALGGVLAAAPAVADLPRIQQQDVRTMDTNKNGRIEREEYLAAMGKMFDQIAGAKGYCTFEEVTEGMRALEQFWRYNP
ncbi:MAG: hypothetical protein M5U08_22510 [Burkholderiales bacterium]|nr:hypothetical protein [Burkholderiales bacterium]